MKLLSSGAVQRVLDVRLKVLDAANDAAEYDTNGRAKAGFSQRGVGQIRLIGPEGIFEEEQVGLAVMASGRGPVVSVEPIDLRTCEDGQESLFEALSHVFKKRPRPAHAHPHRWALLFLV